jgi:putative glycosyltransferase (TIGR04348 family)
VSPVKSAPHVIIASPALAAANNGNWHTAYRWSRMLADDYRVSLLPQWRGVEDGDADALIALHARRSAASIAAWARHWPKRPLIVVLTGTDLYRDIRSDADAQRSLAQATQLVVLQEHGPLELPAEHRAKCVVIFQSAPRLQPGARPSRHLQVVMAGHLRSEKDPLTYLRAVQRLQSRDDLRFEHIGRALEPPLADAAPATAQQCAHYRWHGELSHGQTRQRIKHAHVLVNASVMEGGAQVVIEAVQSDTAVLVSRIGGHIGLLGEAHPGFFDAGDDATLAALVERCRDEPAFLQALLDHGAGRASLFSPDLERTRLLHLMQHALQSQPLELEP